MLDTADALLYWSFVIFLGLLITFLLLLVLKAIKEADKTILSIAVVAISLVFSMGCALRFLLDPLRHVIVQVYGSVKELPILGFVAVFLLSSPILWLVWRVGAALSDESHWLYSFLKDLSLAFKTQPWERYSSTKSYSGLEYQPPEKSSFSLLDWLSHDVFGGWDDLF